VLGSNIGLDTFDYLIEVFHGFSQSLHANARVMLHLGHYSFLTDLFQFIIHHLSFNVIQPGY
jgi:hypothetical protein